MSRAGTSGAGGTSAASRRTLQCARPPRRKKGRAVAVPPLLGSSRSRARLSPRAAEVAGSRRRGSGSRDRRGRSCTAGRHCFPPSRGASAGVAAIVPSDARATQRYCERDDESRSIHRTRDARSWAQASCVRRERALHRRGEMRPQLTQLDPRAPMTSAPAAGSSTAITGMPSLNSTSVTQTAHVATATIIGSGARPALTLAADSARQPY